MTDVFSAAPGFDSHRFLEMELPSQGKNHHTVRLYYNRLDPRQREEVGHSHLAVEIDMFGDDCYGTYVIGKKRYDICPGDIFILRSNEQHSIVNMKKGMHCICTGIQFIPDFIWSPNSELENFSYMYEISVGTDTAFNHRISSDGEIGSRIRREIENIVTEFTARSTGYGLMIKTRLISILVMMAREYKAANGLPDGFTIRMEKRRIIEQVMRYIDDHYAESITLESVASDVNMSPSYLSFLFKKLNGFTLWDYILSKRVNYARQMLQATEDLILNISLESGFNSLTNFNRVFKRITGLSPKEYRKKAFYSD